MPKRVARSFPFVGKDGREGLVRPARPSDAKACLEIAVGIAKERPRVLAVTESELWSVRQWRDHRLPWGKDGVSLVGQIGDELAGTLTIHRGTRKVVRHTAEFGIYLKQDARGIGLGKALIEACEVWAKEFSVSRISLGVFQTNKRGIKLYKSCGYLPEGIEEGGMMLPEGRVNVIRMAKLLT